MEEMLLKAKSEGIETVIFGDIFLEDLKEYREKNLEKVGMKAVFPLWKKDTSMLINDFINSGFKTITCCVNDAFFNEDWVGKEIDESFILNLPKNVDPCGENGEYHTFCYEGPIFKKKINFQLGEKIYKPLMIEKEESCGVDAKVNLTKGFWYCELYWVTSIFWGLKIITHQLTIII